MEALGKSEIAVTREDFATAFPFSICLDGDLRMVTRGRSLEKIFPERPAAAPFLDHWQFIRPSMEADAAMDPAELTGKLVVIESLQEPKVTLRGQFRPVDGGQNHILLTSLVVNSLDQIESLGIDVWDFPHQDHLFDLLHVLKNNEIVTQELKEVLQNTDESHMRLRLLNRLIDNSSDAIEITYENGQLFYLNAAASKRLGIPAKVAEQFHIQELEESFQEAGAWERFIRELKTDKTKKFKGTGIHQITGETMQVEINAQYFHYKKQGYVILISRDVTDQVSLQNQLAEALEDANVASEAKANFLANMSHEIRTPLNGIIGMIRELRKAPLVGEYKQYTESAYRTSQHLLAILNDILDITKIEAGEMDLENDVFVLPDLMQDLHALINPQAVAKGLIHGIEYDPEIPSHWYGDATRLRQILINLAGNAIKFTREGHVTLGCDLVGLEEGRGRLKFWVRDTGIGMTEAEQAQVFKKFKQADEGKARKYGGTGLGLFITHQLIHLMEGNIRMESEPGKGTLVEIEIELAEAQDDSCSTPEIDLSMLAMPVKKILIVEDNAMNRMVAELTLKDHPFEIEEAHHGAEALEMLKENRYDLVLMDIEMPVMNGIEATQKIREELKMHLPIIGLSAGAFKSEIEACKASGMDDYVTKPFEPKELIQTIFKALEKENNYIPPVRPLYDLTYLRSLSAGHPAFLQDMLSIFIGSAQSSVEALRQSLKEKDWQAVKSQIHKIKPSVMHMGIDSIYESMVQIDRYSLNELRDVNPVAEVAKICRTLSRVVGDLKTKELGVA